VLRGFFTEVVVVLICSRGRQEGALSAVCPSQIRVTSIRCSASFPEARLNEAASRQTLSRVWCRQQWREDKVGS